LNPNMLVFLGGFIFRSLLKLWLHCWLEKWAIQTSVPSKNDISAGNSAELGEVNGPPESLGVVGGNGIHSYQRSSKVVS
jgi:hypothetical protein